MSNRFQYIASNGINSNLYPIKTGVPQGSILGPTLFNIFVNDLPLYVNKCNISMYADDVACFSCAKNLNDLYLKFNDDLENISLWYNSNHLSINIDKSNYVIFTSRVMMSKINNLIDSTNLNLKINNNVFSRVNHAKYLGLTLSADLGWETHVDNILVKVNIQIGMLNRLKPFAPKKILLTYYYANIHSHIFYALPIWGVYYNNYLNNLVIAQKRAIRMVDKADYLASADPIFTKYNVLNFNKLWAHSTMCFVFNFLNNIYHSNIPINFSKNVSNYVMNTRSRNLGLLLSSTPHSNAGKFALAFSGPWVWNQLPEEIRNENNPNIFKNLSKNFVSQNNIKKCL